MAVEAAGFGDLDDAAVLWRLDGARVDRVATQTLPGGYVAVAEGDGRRPDYQGGWRSST